MLDDNSANRWLVFSLCERGFAFPVHSVRELAGLEATALHRPAGLPPGVEGIVALRNESIAAIDIRAALGMQSMHDETASVVDLLRAREEDHLNWLQELEHCVCERRRFTLTTDPHKCRFGQWYDKLMGNQQELVRLTNGHLGLLNLFGSFDAPHKRIHAIGIAVNDLLDSGDTAGAHALLQRTRDRDLAKLRDLFARCYDALHRVRRGLLVVLLHDDDVFGAIVDQVEGVVTIEPAQVTPATELTYRAPSLAGIARNVEGHDVLQLIDIAAVREMSAPCAV